MAAIDPRDIRHLVGKGAVAMIEKGLSMQDTPNDIDAKSLHSEFLNYYAAHIADESFTFMGCHDLLEHLKSMGI